VNKREELLARLMNFLADKYKNQLVLKGGMLLRLLNSPRETQDLNYAWIRTKKRNLFAQDLKSSLETLEAVQIGNVLANSRGIFIEVTDANSGEKAKLEINVIESLHCPPKPMTTSALSQPYSLKPQIVTTMDLSEALSNKIAAALERDQIRDLYDLMLMEPLTPFDEKTLRDRLSKLEINRSKPKSVSTKEAAKMLKEKLNSRSGRVADELSSIIPDQPMQGMEMILKASVFRIIQKMELLDV
jgi:predicted nucleotidyltransferase component of viral defense system